MVSEVPISGDDVTVSEGVGSTDILAMGKDDDALLGMMTATHRVAVVASMHASLMVI
jgi:hypothetical protein